MSVTRYVALLRGINVGGRNVVKMADLRAAVERAGVQDVTTYINSGNLLFSTGLDEPAAQALCQDVIARELGLDVSVCVISASDLRQAMAQAPDWWNDGPDSKHNVFFAIPPATVDEICSRVGPVRQEHEKALGVERVVFWSAPVVTFSRTRWSKMISTDKTVHHAITVRNARTALTLARMVETS